MSQTAEQLKARRLDQRVEEPSSWRRIAIDDVLAAEYPGLEPDILTRSDGACGLYCGRTHSVYAPPEAGKTLLADVALAEVLESGLTAALLDFEDTPETTIARLRALGVQDDRIRAGLRYIRPEEPWDATAALVLAEELEG